MKFLFFTILSFSLINTGAGLLFSQQHEGRICGCKDCRCTTKSNCGCYSNKGCTCKAQGYESCCSAGSCQENG